MKRKKNQDTENLLPRRKAVTAEDLLTRNVWEPYFRGLLFVVGIWRNWYWVIPLAITLACATGISLYLLIPHTYTASVWIRLSAQKPYSIFNEPMMSGETYYAFVRTNLAFLKSPQVLEPAFHEITVRAQEEGIPIKSLIPEKDPLGWLDTNLSVMPRDNSEIFILSYNAGNAEGSAILVNAITTSYLRFLAQQEIDGRQGFTQKLASDIDVYKKRIETLRKELGLLVESITEKGGVYQPEMVAQGMRDDAILMEVIRNESTLEMLRKEKEYNEKILEPDYQIELPDSVVESLVETDINIVELVKEQVAIKIEVEDLRKKYSDPNFLEVRRAERRYQSVTEKVEQLRSELIPAKKESWIRELKTKAKHELLHLGQMIDGQERILANLKKQYNERINSMSMGNHDILKATFKQGEILREEMIASILMDKLNQINVEKDSPGQISLIQNAKVPQYPNKKTRLRFVALCTVFVFFVPFGIAWLMEMFYERFYHSQQLRIQFPESSHRFLSNMPNPGLSMTVAKRYRRGFQQNIEEMCSELRHGLFYRNPKIILFSSIQKDDNQVLIATSVAETMSPMIGKPVLLINANFHNDRFERKLGIDTDVPGLSDVLTLQSPLNNTLICDDDHENLFILPAGEIEMPAVNYFTDGKFEQLLEELEKQFEKIIISAPPLYTFSESYVLATMADALILSVRLRDTKRKPTMMVCRKLEDINASPSGFVVS